MPKIALARVAMDDRSELLPMTICAVLVLAGGIGASILSAINITPPYGDILLIAALFVAVIPIFPIGPGRIARQSLLSRLEKIFRPAVIEILDNPLAAAELGDTVLAAQPFQHDADLVFRREVPPGRAPNVFHDLCRRFFRRHGFLSHLRSLRGYDEPEILPSSIHPICLKGADGGQPWITQPAWMLETGHERGDREAFGRPRRLPLIGKHERAAGNDRAGLRPSPGVVYFPASTSIIGHLSPSPRL
jgi:hypothetical protein